LNAYIYIYYQEISILEPFYGCAKTKTIKMKGVSGLCWVHLLICHLGPFWKSISEIKY